MNRSLAWLFVVSALALSGQVRPVAAPQAQDEEYNQLIRKHLSDSRITTELVDHMPASSTVPSPLKFFGRIPGTPGELTYAKDIHRYYQALAKASPRARYWTIGKTEEGREQVILAIADEATLRDLDKYKAQLAQLGDPRRTTEERARQIIPTAKPIYWAMSGIHSPENGGPEMLIELAFRLIVEETPFIQTIRNNMIVFLTPVIEVDGREKQVDTYYYGKKTGKPRPPLMYWGKYVAHDNNRDGMGQYLLLTQNIMKQFLEWRPTVVHDLHEAQSYLYVSTGTGPYNPSIDPIQVNEWWLLAQTEVLEMTKRGVPGVFTYGFYDGWVPNYLFWMAITHNSFGRFYEVQSYGPDVVKDLRLPVTATSREWFRTNPPLPSITWGPRNNTNIQQSGLLLAMNQVAKSKELYLENYWLKNKRSVEKGRTGPEHAWVIPAAQRRKVEAADLVNTLRRQGVEVHRADKTDGAVTEGDYIVRADQPYRTLAEMYFSVQNYPVANPRPYDDTGWTMQLMRNVKLVPVRDKAILSAPMTLLRQDAKVKGTISGSGTALVVDNTTDNTLITFRMRHANVPMLAAEEDFTLDGHSFRAGAFVIPAANRAVLEPSIQELGLSAWAVVAAPVVKTHSLDPPRIGYVHAWQRTQDEGWVRAALDHYGVKYTYFADQKLREGGLRAKYDVIIYPHVGGTTQSHINGIPKVGADPIPYRKSELTPNLGGIDESDDIRGGMGLEGLAELKKFVEEGGLLLTEGSTAALAAETGLATGISVERPDTLFARGSLFRAVVADARSPIAYGYDGKELPVYFNQEPVFTTQPPSPVRSSGNLPAVGQNVTPNVRPLTLSPWEPAVQSSVPAPAAPAVTAPPDEAAVLRARARERGLPEEARARVVIQFPAKVDQMLLSGTLAGGEALVNRALVADATIGKGHVVMFALRPFWRWQTHGTYFLAFNAILNWNHLDAGVAQPGAQSASGQ